MTLKGSSRPLVEEKYVSHENFTREWKLMKKTQNDAHAIFYLGNAQMLIGQVHGGGCIFKFIKRIPTDPLGT